MPTNRQRAGLQTTDEPAKSCSSCELCLIALSPATWPNRLCSNRVRPHLTGPCQSPFSCTLSIYHAGKSEAAPRAQSVISGSYILISLYPSPSVYLSIDLSGQLSVCVPVSAARLAHSSFPLGARQTNCWRPAGRHCVCSTLCTRRGPAGRGRPTCARDRYRLKQKPPKWRLRKRTRN